MYPHLFVEGEAQGIRFQLELFPFRAILAHICLLNLKLDVARSRDLVARLSHTMYFFIITHYDFVLN